MSESKLQILGVGHFHPETVISNSFLESLDIGTTDEWILERVGIQERRTVLPLEYIFNTRNQERIKTKEAARHTVVEMGVQAARKALEKSEITPNEIGLVIGGTCTPQLGVPAHACSMAAQLHIQAPAFDLHASCATFGAQLHFINSMNLASLPDHILLIQSEAFTTVTNYTDRTTAVLFGDGAAAMVLSKKRSGRAEIAATTFGSNPAEWGKVVVPHFDHLVQQGSAVQRFAITQTTATLEKLEKMAGLKIDRFIAHQANLRMLETVCSRIGIENNQHHFNVNLFGNSGGAGAPAVLSRDWDGFEPNCHLGIVVVGGGLSWGGAIIKFKDRF